MRQFDSDLGFPSSWKENNMNERYVVDNTVNDFKIILTENNKKVCDEIRQNNFDFTN